MTEVESGSGPEGAEITTCERCGRPLALCVCDRTVPLATRRRVLILQHPREQDVELGSARLAAMSLPRGKLVVGLSWGSLAQALGEPAVPSRWAVVFPRKRDANERELPVGGFALEGNEDERVSPRGIDGIVVLDGSWSQAKTLWWRNSWLLKLKRLTLRPKEPSIYGTLRPEPRRDYVSTLESVGAALTALGESAEVEAGLRRAFRTLVQRARDTGPTPRKAKAGRAGRLQRRRKTRPHRGP
jgi:DTW domain-containing protein YfiP